MKSASARYAALMTVLRPRWTLSARPVTEP